MPGFVSDCPEYMCMHARMQQKDEHTSSVRIQAPVQVEILEQMPVEQALAELKAAGLQPPLLVKPLWTDGREGSHGLAVVHDMASMRKLLQGEVSPDLKPPIVVQEFVEHGGVLYKVSIVHPVVETLSP